MSNRLTIIIHSYNSERLIECIKSALQLGKEIIVIGEEKRENVLNDLKKFDANFIPFPNQGIVEPAREFGINQVKTDWVFLLDADERMTAELAREISQIITTASVIRNDNNSKTEAVYITHYKVPRKEIVFVKTCLPAGRWLKHGGWWPNYQTRLIKKSAFVSWPKDIHSTPIIKGNGGLLTYPLLHYSQNNIEEIVNRTVIFEDKESDLLYKADKQAGTLTFFRKFAGELWRRLIRYGGFLDGSLGIIESIYQAFSKTITYIFLYEKRIKKGGSIRSLS